MRASGDPYLSVGRSNYLGGDKPLAALKLLQKVDDLNYLVLECSAERTLADRYQEVLSGGEGFDPRNRATLLIAYPLTIFCYWSMIKQFQSGCSCSFRWLLRKECALLLTWVQVLEIASGLGIKITVGVAHQFDSAKAGLMSFL
ncbi:hypothetical protein HanPSC8_Chr08g0328101 [Helianthus annuus]|nr:hypothetical protein HanPSC8_Chr08g0328101 [Helianthus annuus]